MSNQYICFEFEGERVMISVDNIVIVNTRLGYEIHYNDNYWRADDFLITTLECAIRWVRS